MDKKRKTRLVGRDPGMGRVSFKTGVTLHRKDRLKKRTTKLAQQEKRHQLRGE